MSGGYKPEFREDEASQRLDPLADMHQGFDYDAVEKALGLVLEMPDEARDQMCAAMAAFIEYIVGSLRDYNLVAVKRRAKGAPVASPESNPITPQENRKARCVGHRTLAVAWVLRPDLFGGVSLTKLAEALGVNKMTLSQHSSDFSSKFGIRNRGQSHGRQHGKRKAAGTTALQSAEHDAVVEHEKDGGESDG